jgi:arginine repressor
MSKSYRHGQIFKLIRSRNIRTQEELARELKLAGIPATQVTLSRDIREMRLIKTRDVSLKPMKRGPPSKCWPGSSCRTCAPRKTWWS